MDRLGIRQSITTQGRTGIIRGNTAAVARQRNRPRLRPPPLWGGWIGAAETGGGGAGEGVGEGNALVNDIEKRNPFCGGFLIQFGKYELPHTNEKASYAADETAVAKNG